MFWHYWNKLLFSYWWKQLAKQNVLRAPNYFFFLALALHGKSESAALQKKKNHTLYIGIPDQVYYKIVLHEPSKD